MQYIYRIYIYIYIYIYRNFERDSCLTSEFGSVKLMLTSGDVLNYFPSRSQMKNIVFLKKSIANMTSEYQVTNF